MRLSFIVGFAALALAGTQLVSAGETRTAAPRATPKLDVSKIVEMRKLSIYYRKHAQLGLRLRTEPNFAFTCSEVPNSRATVNGAQWWSEVCSANIPYNSTFLLAADYIAATGGVGGGISPIDGQCGTGPGGYCSYKMDKNLTFTLPEYKMN